MKSTKIKFFIEFIKLKRTLYDKEIFFFFPFYHIGGAERVHLDILKVFKNHKTVCFITNNSENKAFYEEFKTSTTLIEVNTLMTKYLQKYINYFVKKINSKSKNIVFSCNSRLFYDLIPRFSNHIQVIDLIHAFAPDEKLASENYSIPYVDRINKRVVLGQKTLNDFKNLYQKNNIDLSNLTKINIIKNKVEIPEFFQLKSENDALKILFVGRNSYEKRPEIFFEIAKTYLEKKNNISFTVIGDFKNYKNDIPKNVAMIGEINEPLLIKKYYSEADLILITSSREGMPMVILEGMANGVLPICTDVGEISELIKPELENGFLITNYENDHEIIKAFCDTIDFLDQNRYLLKKYQENGYNSIKENYSPEKFKAAYLELFS